MIDEVRQNRGRRRLPAMLEPFFWDVDFAHLDWETHQDFIIARVLSEGTWGAVKWLRTRLGDENLRNWILSKKGGPLDPRQLSFWQLILDLPGKEVDSWIRARKESIWGRRLAPR